MKWTALSLLPLLGVSAGILALHGGTASACDKSAASACGKVQKVAEVTKGTACAAQQAVPTNTTTTVASTTQQPAAEQPTTASMDAGMRAYIDPETGQLTSIPPAGTVEPARADVELLQVRMPDGSFMLDQKNAPEDYLIMKLDANGKKVVECTQDPTKAMQTPAVPQREDR